jgi:hypothetical protein
MRIKGVNVRAMVSIDLCRTEVDPSQSRSVALAVLAFSTAFTGALVLGFFVGAADCSKPISREFDCDEELPPLPC